MKRSDLKRFAEQLADELTAKGYDYWHAHPPNENVVEVHEFEGQQLQVEIQVLEHTEDFIQIGIAVSDAGFWSSCFPASTSAVIKKSGAP